MKKILLLLIIPLFSVACMGGQTYKHALHNDEIIIVEDVGHSSLARNGAQMSIFYRCDGTKEDPRNCQEIGQPIQSVNAPMLPWILNSGATVGAAALIGDGLRDSGDNINVNGGSAKAGASTSSTSNASSKAKGSSVKGKYKTPYNKY